MRRAGRIVSVAAIVAVAANTEGRREVLGLAIGPSEAEKFWTDFPRSLGARAASSRWSPMPTRGLNAPSPRRWAPLGNAAAFTSCATPGSRHQGATRDGRRRHPHRLRPGGLQCRRQPMAPGRRPPAQAFPRARQGHGRGGSRRARLHDLPEGSLARRITGPKSIPPTHASGSTRRSKDGPTSSASFPTSPP